MCNIRSHCSFPGNGRKFETEKDFFLFFFFLTVLQGSFTCQVHSLGSVNNQLIKNVMQFVGLYCSVALTKVHK